MSRRRARTSALKTSREGRRVDLVVRDPLDVRPILAVAARIRADCKLRDTERSPIGILIPLIAKRRCPRPGETRQRQRPAGSIAARRKSYVRGKNLLMGSVSSDVGKLRKRKPPGEKGNERTPAAARVRGARSSFDKDRPAGRAASRLPPRDRRGTGSGRIMVADSRREEPDKGWLADIIDDGGPAQSNRRRWVPGRPVGGCREG